MQHFKRMIVRILLPLATAGLTTAHSGCGGVEGDVSRTLGLAFRIVDVWV
jgi:hypothetical protein